MSNFFPSKITISGLSYPSVEHYFQSIKSSDYVFADTIRHANTPTIAKALGRKCPMKENWEVIKEDVMLKALREKFSDENLKHLLLNTGNSVLIEHTPRDSYWGNGGNGSEKNRLGILLMKVREERVVTILL